MTGNTGNTGNTGDTGNTGNTGNAGISGDMGGGWFINDRSDLPFVSSEIPAGYFEVEPIKTLRSNTNVRPRISQLRRTDLPPNGFDDRDWSARWNAWRVLHQFIGTDSTWRKDAEGQITERLSQALSEQAREIDDLVRAARDERAAAMAEILSQDGEFISEFMGLLSIAPGSHPQTYRVLHIASLIGSFAVLYFKDLYQRPRPSQVVPALLPPVPIPGHPSFPSGHATQAYLMARCIVHVLEVASIDRDTVLAIEIDLRVLADRVARNREIAGLHYESDSRAGELLAGVLAEALKATNVPLFKAAVEDAGTEWRRPVRDK